jgi:hypothetical protein
MLCELRWLFAKDTAREKYDRTKSLPGKDFQIVPATVIHSCLSHWKNKTLAVYD